MKIYMYEDRPNFGDVLNRYLWLHYLQSYLQRDDDVLMLGIGTLLGDAIAHPGRVVVCGTGCGYEKRTAHIHDGNWKIFFVRGPLTAKILGLDADLAITDPAILTPDVFPPSPSTGNIVFVPHWETSFNPLWKQACEAAGIVYVDPLAPVPEVIAKISGARLVISEAMHGAILADAYRVPWIPVSTSARVNRFKWTDWAKSLGVEPELYCLAPLGLSDHFRGLTGDIKTARILKQAAAIDDDMLMPQTGQPRSRLSNRLNVLFTHLVPGRYQPKIARFLLAKIGPYFDSKLAESAAKGGPAGNIRRAARELDQLAKQTGWLSADTMRERQKRSILEKLEDLKTYLDNG